MAELLKLAVILTFLVFALPILLHLTFWILTAAASGNIIPFIIFLVTVVYCISNR